LADSHAVLDGMSFEVKGDFDSFYLCHCRYCLKDTGSAYAANLFSQSAKQVWRSGEDAVTSYRLLRKKVMKLRRAVFLLLLASVNSYGASFDCSRASTGVERTICESDRLGSLDEELASLYTRLREFLLEDASSELLAGQREWIRERNRSCEASADRESCLVEKYRERIHALKSRYDESFLPGRASLAGMCGEIAALDAPGRRQYGDSPEADAADGQAGRYDINNDGVLEIAEQCYGGTMAVPCVAFRQPDGNPLNSRTVDYEWKDYWTYGLRIFRKDGRWFSLHSYDDDLLRPAYVSYMTPGNKEYVVCEFENTESWVYHANEKVSGAAEICSRFRNGGVDGTESVALTETPVMSRLDLRELGMSETGLKAQGHVDYDNDGIKEYVGEFQYASGAGRGCDLNFFDELTPDGKSLASGPSRDLLRKMQGRHCGGMNNRLFSYRGEIYYELNTPDERGIALIRNNRIEKVCTAEKKVVSGVKAVGIPGR